MPLNVVFFQEIPWTINLFVYLISSFQQLRFHCEAKSSNSISMYGTWWVFPTFETPQKYMCHLRSGRRLCERPAVTCAPSHQWRTERRKWYLQLFYHFGFWTRFLLKSTSRGLTPTISKVFFSFSCQKPWFGGGTPCLAFISGMPFF